MSGIEAYGPFDDLLLAELRAACEHAHALAAKDEGLPSHGVPTLVRTPNGLQAATREELDWSRVLPALSRREGFWPRMVELVGALADDTHVASDLGWQPDLMERAVPLWQSLIGPMVARYGRRRPDWEWDENLARTLIAEWRASHCGDPVWHRTIAPLHNLEGMRDPINIDRDLVIREMTDDDRDDLWRHFGDNTTIPSPVNPMQLETWTHVIDLRWAMPRRNPVSDEPAIRRIADVVSALRLHHPGVTGTTLLWTQLDPPDAPLGLAWPNQRLFELPGAAFTHPLRTHVGPGDAAALRVLIDALEPARKDHRLALALRRFDNAYERHNQQDALVDLWIAFEALLVPDGTSELRYRAALCIARLAGETSAEREEAFGWAKRSYDARSKVVHGNTAPNDLDTVLDKTRGLARLVLRRWVVDPPDGGVDDVDRALLA